MEEETAAVRIEKARSGDIPANVLVILPWIIKRRMPTPRSKPRHVVGVSRWSPHKAHAVVVMARNLFGRDNPSANTDLVEIFTHIALHPLEHVRVPPRAFHTRTLIKTYSTLLWRKIYKRIFSYFFDLFFSNAELCVSIIRTRKHMCRRPAGFSFNYLYPYVILRTDRAKKFDRLRKRFHSEFLFRVLVELKINVRFYGICIQLHASVCNLRAIMMRFPKCLSPPFGGIAVVNTRVKPEFCGVILYLDELYLRIVGVDRALYERFETAPRPHIKMRLATKRGYLKRPKWPHTSLPSAIDGGRFARGEIERNEREFHSARRFENIAWHFHLEQNAVAPCEIKGLYVPYPCRIRCIVETTRQPDRGEADDPPERKEREIWN